MAPKEIHKKSAKIINDKISKSFTLIGFPTPHPQLRVLVDEDSATYTFLNQQLVDYELRDIDTIDTISKDVNFELDCLFVTLEKTHKAWRIIK